MKNNLGVIILVALALVGGYLFSGNPVNLGSYGGQDIYMIDDFTHSTSSIGLSLSGSGTPDLIKDINTGRQSLECFSNEQIRIWLTNTTNTTMVSGANSDGRPITASTTWNMKDYGYIWPGKIYGIADTATATVSCIEN